jgi:hypothetical protein
MNAYTITAATESGFYVTERVMPGDYSPVLFAGSLGECLRFVRNKLGGLSDGE